MKKSILGAFALAIITAVPAVAQDKAPGHTGWCKNHADIAVRDYGSIGKCIEARVAVYYQIKGLRAVR